MSVLNKATQVLDCLSRADAPLRLNEVAAGVGLPKSSAHRLIGELTALGLVRRVGDGYLLGPRLVYWGMIAGAGIDLRAYAEGPMRRLRDELGESVHLYVVDNGQRVCIASVESRYSLRPFVALGLPLPLGVGSSGRLLLAFTSVATQRAVIAELERAGDPHVPTLAELDDLRARHWAVSHGEREDGIVAAATTVRGPGDRVVAVLTVSGPSTRITPAHREEFHGPMTACGAEIAALLEEDSFR